MYRDPYDLSPRIVTGREQRARTIGHIVYALYLIALFTGLSIVVGAIVAYVLRRDTDGTVYRSHLDYLIATFWVALLVAIVAGLLVFTLILIPVSWVMFGLLWLWLLYRVVRGWLRLNDGRPA